MGLAWVFWGGGPVTALEGNSAEPRELLGTGLLRLGGLPGRLAQGYPLPPLASCTASRAHRVSAESQAGAPTSTGQPPAASSCRRVAALTLSPSSPGGQEVSEAGLVRSEEASAAARAEPPEERKPGKGEALV